jgi:tetratricopeptide (TPR) repeat protein
MTPVLRFRGRTRELRAELDALLPVLRSNRACCAEDLVVALKNQAHLEIDDGRYTASEVAAYEAVDVAVNTLGNHHPETVASLMVLAYAQQFTRSPEQALQSTERAYRSMLEVYAETPTHPRAIEGRLLYGRALGLAGELPRGVAHLSRAVSDAATVFGPTSRMVGFFSEPLARFQTEAGDIDAALASSQRAVAIVASHSQPDSFRMAVALHAHGAALLAAQRIDEALPDLARAMTIVQARFPTANEFRRTFQTDYALAVALSAHPTDAEQLVAPFVPASRPLYVIGVMHRRTNNSRAALDDEQRALSALPAGKSSEIDRMRILTEIGLDLQALGQPDQASTFLHEALAISEHAQTHDSPARAEIMAALQRAPRAQSQHAPPR